MDKEAVKAVVFKNKYLKNAWDKFVKIFNRNRFKYRKLLNKLYFQYLLHFKGYKEVRFDKKITNGMFKIFVCHLTNKVIKINKRENIPSNNLYKKLKDKEEFERYKKVLTSSDNLDFLQQHTCPVLRVYKDGGYESPYIAGVNMQVLKIKLSAKEIKLTTEEIQGYLEALERLYLNLKKSYEKNGYLPGDWMLYNLVYNKNTKNIINVDIEGFYNYQGFVPERINNLYFKELIALLKDRKEDTQLKSNA